MMTRRHLQIELWLLTVLSTGLVVGGCPVTGATLDGAAQATQLAGDTYWVDYRVDPGELLVFELPAARLAPGRWQSFPGDQPDWFAGPGLYELAADGVWTPLEQSAALTLDDVIQLHDAAPPVSAP